MTTSHEFYQQGPELQNTFESDPFLKKWFESKLKSDEKKQIFEHLGRCGKKAVTSWLECSVQAEKQVPELVSFDPWGRRIDEIKMSAGWKALENEAATEGVVAAAYERRYGALSRPFQMALLYLFHPSSAFVSCPLAMTDGAARCLELIGTPELKAKAFKNLTTRNPQQFWTSGQWMTERSGGSDVSGTSTQAVAHGDDYKLYGTKWFTSATTSQMSLMLARTQDAASLTMFYVELRDQEGKLKNIEVHRLKDKLGTKGLPTAELSLKGTQGIRIGEIGQGVKNISTLLNVTRLYNAICATSHMRRGLDFLKSYSQVRMAFGKKLIDHPLHAKTLNDLEKTWARNFVFVFRLCELLGKDEVKTISPVEKVELRAMTPLVKLFTAKDCVRVISEVCEGFGGAGYVEDTGIPKLLRDAQVFSIWEGTTNVLSLDFLRALKKEAGAIEWFQSTAQELLKTKGDLEMGHHQMVLKHVLGVFQSSPEKIEELARDLALSFAFLYSNKLFSESGL